ncbi:uncharacterized protein LOC133305540 [Gastrolobium bilobum]|uniref:uncharacterized protein LOC133305540 n=1 Tax=Gastrolobium bilobum TaxID=150636 RepID=UPI002AB2A2D5|nr:uncharacterized protein LOC133305540 [Gastrolobium bilobum]
MNILEYSPLEPLAFNYLNFGFLTLLNNLLTRLAVTFWRIRAPKSELLPPSDDPTSETTDPDPVVSEPDDAVREPARVPTVVGNGGADDVDGVTKGKFTLYYEDDKEYESDETLTVTEVWDEKEGRSEWWDNWEKLLRMRMGENEDGWYTCQDLTSLNGNVVRLWDGGLRFGTFTKESRDSSTCVRMW